MYRDRDYAAVSGSRILFEWLFSSSFFSGWSMAPSPFIVFLSRKVVDCCRNGSTPRGLFFFFYILILMLFFFCCCCYSLYLIEGWQWRWRWRRRIAAGRTGTRWGSAGCIISICYCRFMLLDSRCYWNRFRRGRHEPAASAQGRTHSKAFGSRATQTAAQG